MHQIHIHAPHAPPNINMCTNRCTIYTCAPHVPQLQVHIYVLFTHTCTTKHICVHRCTIYTYVQHMNTCSPHASLHTYVHHQTPPKIKIYLVSIPSALYERPDQNERCVEFSCFCCFSGAFHIEKAHFRCFFMKSTGVFSWKMHAFHVLFKRPLANNCNPIFVTVCKMCCINFYNFTFTNTYVQNIYMYTSTTCTIHS